MKNTPDLSAPRQSQQWILIAAAAMALFSWRTPAAIPSPEKLLPDDTLVVLTVPDFAKAREIYQTSPQTQLWNDPAMKPFRDHFMSKLNDEVIEPLERELGVHLNDYLSLPEGQLTFALTQNGWKGTDSQLPGFLVLVDAKDRSSQLKTNLAELKRKWLDAGKSIKTEKIREIEFSILPLSAKDVPKSLKKVFSAEDSKDASDETNQSPKAELVFGQFESLLILGNSTKAVEKVAVHLTGGSMPSLGDLAAYESARVAMFRDAPFFGWVNTRSFVDLLTQKSGKDQDGNPMAAMFNVQKIISATGLGGLKTLAFSLQTASEGVSFQFFMGVPESGRQGIFKLFPAPGKESGPPPFVPADAVKFQRCRIDGQKAWATLQSMLGEISPEMIGSLNFILDTANEAQKQKDPNFDLRKNLFGNLGDDLITYEKAAQGTTLADLNSAPSLFLIGSPHPDQFAAALKSILTLMNPQGGNPKEREFLGRKIYSMPAPASPLAGGNTAKAGATLSYAASGSYVAISTETTLLEEYLRSSDGEQKSLREAPGLTEAAAKVGGTSTGWFVYENQAETTRAALEILRKSAANTDPKMLAPGLPAFTPENPFKEWMDFSLLPEFEKIAKYFYFSVYAGNASADGLTFNVFSPVPPQLKK
jgi:hypothetical protein